jgi:hypothetical protein
VDRANRFVRLWWALALGVALLFACSVPPQTAQADDLSDFEAARAAYDAQDYPKAVELFEALVGVSPPRLTDRLLVLESRKYLGASLLFVRQGQRAREQFRLLVLTEPDYLLDPLAFPTEVIAVFDQVKSEVQAEIEKAAQAERMRLAQEMREQQEAEQQRRRNLAELVAIAETEQVKRANSRWIASVPFGVGQFQNGHAPLGSALAVLQGVAAATSATSFILHQQLRSESPSPAEVPDATRREELWHTVNIASFSIFVALAAIGVVDAHIRFVPERVMKRVRPLPSELETWVQQETNARLAPGPRR